MSQDPTVHDFYNLACIREIVEPKPGTLMLPELVEKIRADYARVERLELALIDYGQHKPRCKVYEWSPEMQTCTCGLSAAIENRQENAK